MANRVETTCKLKTYNDHGNNSVIQVEVKSHWNDKYRVTLVVDGMKVDVLAEDLNKAIDNCTNV